MPTTTIEPITAAQVQAIEREVLAGLPNEQARRLKCLTSVKYYRLRGAELIPRREAESDQDYLNRPKRSLPLTRRVINVLTSKLYAPGPSRRIADDDGATKWLDGVYDQAGVNGLLQQADRMAHLNGMAAVQVAATGDPDRPLALQLWSGWHEIALFEAPGRANEVAACVTIDCWDETTRYTLWTPTEYRAYESRKLKPGQTSGGRAATFLPDESGPNPYGCLPFAFVWFERPTGGVDEQEGLGPFLANLNATIDVEMSDMAQAVQKYHAPLLLAYDCSIEWSPVAVPGKPLRVVGDPTDFDKPPAPRLEYLQAKLDVGGGWENIRQVIDSQLEALGVPLTAYRMDSRTLPSGAALIAEQKPLTDYATGRRSLCRDWEASLARVCLTAAGAYYGRADLAAAGLGGRLQLAWPPPSIDLPSADRDEQDRSSLELGMESRVMIAMRRFGLSREQALEHLRQAAEDEAELGRDLDEPEPPPQPAADEPEEPKDDGRRIDPDDFDDDEPEPRPGRPAGRQGA